MVQHGGLLRLIIAEKAIAIHFWIVVLAILTGTLSNGGVRAIRPVVCIPTNVFNSKYTLQND